MMTLNDEGQHSSLHSQRRITSVNVYLRGYTKNAFSMPMEKLQFATLV